MYKSLLKLSTIFLLLAAFLLSSCGTKKILINVKRPAEVNLKDYKKIAVGDVVYSDGRVNQKSRDVSDEITSALFETKRFEVLDRQNINKLISEQKLGITGLVDENSAAELGKIIGSAAMVFGRLQTDEYKEETSKRDWVEKKKVGKKGNKRTVKINHTTYSRDGIYKLSVNVKLVDIETAKMLAVKTLPSVWTASTSETDAAAPAIDKKALYRKCLADIKSQFTKLVAPYEVQVEAAFETDDALPEVEQALTQFKIGEWQEGVTLLDAAAKKPGLKQEVKAKAFYNLGMAKMYGGEHEAAIDLFKNAMKLKPDSSRYQKAVIKAKEEKKKADKLKEQS